MQPHRTQPVSGHVFLVDRKRGAQWYMKWRDGDGQHQRHLGPAWTGKGAPPGGYLRSREAKAALDEKLVEARKGVAKSVRTGVTFKAAAEEWLRHGEHERGLKRSTMGDYRSVVRKHLIPAFGTARLEDVTAKRIERWRGEWLAKHGHHRQAVKLLAILHGIFERARRVYGLKGNPAADVERLRVRYDRTDYDFFSPEEVWALVRAAASEQDGAMYLTAAFAGLRRGELVALRWRDVDFEQRAIRVQGNYSHGEVVVPKSGKGRAVPMAPDVATQLARLSQRGHCTRPDDPVFPGTSGRLKVPENETPDLHLDASALRRRYAAALEDAGLRGLRFHDLRHTFGSIAINRASIVQVQAWMGHADVDTTSRYLHHKSRAEEADLLAEAFRTEPEAVPA
jgi:integrase